MPARFLLSTERTKMRLPSEKLRTARHVAPQHGDRIVTIEYYDVTSP